MSDPLYYSLWLAQKSPLMVPVTFKQALETFPFSKLRPGGILQVQAISSTEPALLEVAFEGEVDVPAIVARAQEYLNGDTAFVFHTHWDLWLWDGEWKLAPSPASIEVYAPEFETDSGEQVRYLLGEDSLFLPNPQSDQLRPVQSNIRSVLRLAKDAAESTSAERRLLWSEGHENFAATLEEMLAGA